MANETTMFSFYLWSVSLGFVLGASATKTVTAAMASVSAARREEAVEPGMISLFLLGG
jgi:ABC-type arginine transport system permease subunit